MSPKRGRGRGAGRRTENGPDNGPIISYSSFPVQIFRSIIGPVFGPPPAPPPGPPFRSTSWAVVDGWLRRCGGGRRAEARARGWGPAGGAGGWPLWGVWGRGGWEARVCSVGSGTPRKRLGWRSGLRPSVLPGVVRSRRRARPRPAIVVPAAVLAQRRGPSTALVIRRPW